MKKISSSYQGLPVYTKEQCGALGIAPISQGLNGSSVYDIINNMMIELIESEKEIPWTIPWASAQYNMYATNFSTKHVYTGINFFILNYYAREKGFTHPYWMTFNQIKKANAKLKKNSKGLPVYYMAPGYKHNFLTNSDNEKLVYYNWQKARVIDSDVKNWETFYFARYYKVFNGADIEGIDFKLPPPKKFENAPIESAERIVLEMPNKPQIKTGGKRAFYSPLKDVVQVPDIADFKVLARYYSVLFHELTHSTMHPKRLGERKRNNYRGNGFGSEKYAFEELIAELGAVYLCAEAGILFHTKKQSAAYMQSWRQKLVKHLKNNNRLFFEASAEAQLASEFILGDAELIKKKAEPTADNSKLAVAKAKAIAIKLKLVEETALAGNVIEPQKQVKANISRAIGEVLELDKFKDIPKHTAGIVFSMFKNKNKIEPDIDYKEGGLIQKAIEVNAFLIGLIDYDDTPSYFLSDYGKSFVSAVKGRLQSLKTIKSGGDLFPESANVPEYSKKEGAKARAKAISIKLKLSA